jgi:hypothetical protein
LPSRGRAALQMKRGRRAAPAVLLSTIIYRPSPLNGKAFGGQARFLDGRWNLFTSSLREPGAKMHVLPRCRPLRRWGSHGSERGLWIGRGGERGGQYAPRPIPRWRWSAATDGARSIRSWMRSLGDVPPNKPLQRTTPPQGHWCNINELLVRRRRR